MRAHKECRTLAECSGKNNIIDASSMGNERMRYSPSPGAERDIDKGAKILLGEQFSVSAICLIKISSTLKLFSQIRTLMSICLKAFSFVAKCSWRRLWSEL